MEAEKKISPAQLVILLIMSRVPFATSYFIALGDSNSIQDVLPALPVNFALNFLLAIPLLLLMKTYPGKDPVECARLSLGKAGGYAAAVFYTLCFVLVPSYDVSTFETYFRSSVMPEIGQISVVIPMCLVIYYAVIKGIEALGRFGTVVIIAYAVVVMFIMGSLSSVINPGYLSPLFYNGPSVFLKAVLNGAVSNVQIVYLAFCTPFLKKDSSPLKVFTWWNVITTLMLFLTELMAIIVMGPLAGKQKFPLSTLAIQSRIGVFERVDSFDMIAWILETLLMSAFVLLLCVRCSERIRRGKHTKAAALIAIAAVVFISPVVSKPFLTRHFITMNPVAAATSATAMAVLPSAMLIGGKLRNGRQKDVVKA
jgi:spore germination protein KB